MPITQQEKAMLDGHNFNFKPLLKTGSLDFGHVAALTFKVAIAFMAPLTFLSWWIRYDHELLSEILAAVSGVAILFWPTVAFLALIFTLSLHHPKEQQPSRPAMLYWAWWPTWTFLGCITGLILGVMLGNYLWEDLNRYYELKKLRAYGGVDPSRVSGKQMEDSGILTFADGVTLDRAHGGCFVNGATYCIAPIAMDGKVRNLLPTGSQDFFAVGINCCDCPLTDFRCGAWNNPFANGGLRSTDSTHRAYYKLAAQEWSAMYSMEIANPLFYEWSTDAHHEFHMFYERSINLYAMAMVAAPCIACCFALMVNVMLGCLNHVDLAAPAGEPPRPPQALKPVWRQALPELHHHILGLEKSRGPPQVVTKFAAMNYNSI